MDEVTTRLWVHQGDLPGELRVSNQNRWYVTEQTWVNGRTANFRILKTFKTREEAEQYRDSLENK